jgi:hypothetical protein
LAAFLPIDGFSEWFAPSVSGGEHANGLLGFTT